MCTISPKREARTHRLRAPLVPKVKLGYLDCLWTVLEFCTLYRGMGSRGVEEIEPTTRDSSGPGKLFRLSKMYTGQEEQPL